MWLPDQMITPGTSRYVQGISWPGDRVIPDGYELIELPSATYLQFQGEPFDEADYGSAIEELREKIEQYDPSADGYAFDQTLPRIQWEPIGRRGYREWVGVSSL